MKQGALLTALKGAVSPFGLVNSLQCERLEDAGRIYFLARARLNAITRAGILSPPETGFGFSKDQDEANLKAICEALERCCGLNFSASDAVRARWVDVRDRAVDPSACLGYTDDQLGAPNFPLRTLDSREWQEWVPCRRLATNDKALVLADQVGLPSNAGLAWLSSGGMAIHSSATAAIESALLELIERDHLALAFWHGEPCPRLPDKVLPDDIACHLASMRDAGFRVHGLLLQYGLGIPVVLWLAFRASEAPHFLKGAAAGFDLQAALARGFQELLRTFLHYRTHPLPWCPNPQGGVKNLLHYQTPDVESRLGFLVGPEASAMPDGAAACSMSGLVTRLEEAGHPAYVADMTHPLVRGLGLICVRAICPGLVRTPIGDEPWQLGLPRLRNPGSQRDAELAAHAPLHFFT